LMVVQVFKYCEDSITESTYYSDFSILHWNHLNIPK